MKVVVLSGTPKSEGLSASCVTAATTGVEKAGASVVVIDLCKTSIERCKVCGDGWGICRNEHVCAYGEDGFNEVSKEIAEADALVIQTPVYWGETSEVLKSFLDRFRRCEALKENTALTGKEVLLIAAPGGSGNGLLTCLGQMERAVQHMRGHVFDYIGVNRWNQEYKLKAIEAAAEALALHKI
jgi:multimeric flavodoxin WrbA